MVSINYEEWAFQYAGFESPHKALTGKEERLIGEDIWDIAIRFQLFDNGAARILPEYRGLNGSTPDLSRQPLIKDVRDYAKAIRENLERARIAAENPRNNLERIIILQNMSLTPMQREFEAVFGKLNSTTGFFHLKNVNLALRMAWDTYYRNGYLGIDLDDFASEALKKLEDAAGSFDFSRGNKFSTYARPSIDKGLKRIMAKKRKIERRPFSIYSGPSGVERPYLGVSNQEPDPSTAVRLSESMQMLPQEVRDAVSTLSEVEQAVIYHRFGLNGGETMTLEEVGQIIGVTKERIRQIQIKAIEELRKRMADSSITYDDLVHAIKLG